MRKMTYCCCLIIMLILSVNVVAQETTYESSSSDDRTFGIGVILGEPTGISVKLWLSGSTALDGGAAWSWGEKYSLHFHGDYLFHNFTLLEVESGQLPLYYGIGGRLKLRDDKFKDDDDRFGVRFPVGLSYLFEDAPLDIFIEVVPILDVAPETDFDMNAAVGIRYNF